MVIPPVGSTRPATSADYVIAFSKQFLMPRWDAAKNLCLLHLGQIAPTRRPFDAHGDDRMLRDLHRLELRVPGTEQRLRLVVFGTIGENFGVSVQHDPAEQVPILSVTIDDDGDRRIL